MEYLLIIYPERRRVIIDDIETGEVGQVIQIEEGHHTISLDGPEDYEPNCRDITVLNTSPLSPITVYFEKKIG